LDIVSGVLSGEEGSYINSQTNPGEIKAHYTGGDETSQLTFQLMVGPNMGGAELTDYISYRDNLIIVNGSVTDNEGNEIIYSLPNKDSDNSFASHTQILPLLQQFDTPIFTEDQVNDFEQSLEGVFIEQSFAEIYNNWPRTERNVYYANITDAENNPPWWGCLDGNGNFAAAKCASAYWQLLANPERVQQPQNARYLNTFVSPDSLENYTFEATLNSNASDDDYIGLVIAYERNKADYCSIAGDHDPNTCTTTEILNGINNSFLILMRSGNGVSPLTGDNGRFGILYWIQNTSGSSKFRDLYWSRRVFDESTESRQNWRNNKYTRVKIVRDGNIIKAWTGPFTNFLPDPNNPQYSDDYIEIDLASDSRLHKFIGKRQYGYATYSQPYSQYYDISLVGGTVQRRDFSILVSTPTQNGQTEVREYHKADDQGDFVNRDLGRLQSDLGYLRPLYNDETHLKFLLTADGIIEYPFEE